MPTDTDILNDLERRLAALEPKVANLEARPVASVDAIPPGTWNEETVSAFNGDSDADALEFVLASLRDSANGEATDTRIHPEGARILLAHLDAARAKLGAVNARLYEVERERDDARDLYTTAERQRCDALSQYDGAIRELDAALDRVDQSLALVSALTAERDAARDKWDLAEADADEWEQRAKDFMAERDAARDLLTDAEHTRDMALSRVEDVEQERDALLAGTVQGHEACTFPCPECDALVQRPSALSPADTLSGAEEMLRRIAATACLDLDATEAGAIVAELDRLREKAGENV